MTSTFSHESIKMRLLEDAAALVAICNLAGPNADLDDFGAAIDLVGAPMMLATELAALRGLILRGPDSFGSSEAAIFFSTPSSKDALIVELISRVYPTGHTGYSWRLTRNDGRLVSDNDKRYQLTGQAFAAAARLLNAEALAAA